MSVIENPINLSLHDYQGKPGDLGLIAQEVASSFGISVIVSLENQTVTVPSDYQQRFETQMKATIRVRSKRK